MTADELNRSFGVPGVLEFEDHAGLLRAQVSLPACRATVYLHGAQVTDWQPANLAPVLFLSDRSAYLPDKAIRGGIPICWPWFGARSDGQPGPAHGFVRLEDWDLAFAALLPGAEQRLHLTFTLAPTAQSRALGFDHFRLACEMIFGADLGRTLALRLSVANTGTQPLRFEEALHSYLRVENAAATQVLGLEGALYLDKTDANREKHAPAGPLVLTAETDRVFPGQAGPATLTDGPRRITVAKRNSATTVVWNPWAEGTAKLADLAPDAWRRFVCVEAANTGTDAVTLAPGEAHTMEAVLTAG